MGLFSDLRHATGEPAWRDMFKWRCPKCNDIWVAEQWPGPGEEEKYFQGFNIAICACGYMFGVDPERVYYRCPKWFRMYTYENRRARPSGGVISCPACKKDHKESDLEWETALEPLYVEKLRNSKRMAVERYGQPEATVNTAGQPKRVIQRRVVQTADGTFAEETIVEF